MTETSESKTTDKGETVFIELVAKWMHLELGTWQGVGRWERGGVQELGLKAWC